MNWKLPSLDSVLQIHTRLIERFGGGPGIRDLTLIQSALGRLETGYEKTLFEAAASLMFGLAKNHGFVDGNKRVAYFVTEVFLDINGFYLDFDDEEAHRFIIHLFETGEFTKENLTPWIEQHAVKINS